MIVIRIIISIIVVIIIIVIIIVVIIIVVVVVVVIIIITRHIFRPLAVVLRCETSDILRGGYDRGFNN